MADAILISPHLDDAALSCTGAVTRLIAAGVGVTIVTVCTADEDPSARLSPLARRSHASWGLGATPFAPRRDEDAEAMRRLGARGLHLGLADAVYRRDSSGRPLYRRPVRVRIHPHDLSEFLPSLRASLEGVFAETPADLVVCPLGLGGHVDHVLARMAVESLRDAESVVYYEEYPYLAFGTDATPSPHNVVSRDLALLAPTREEFEARIEAIACYRSQVRGLFPSRQERVREILAARLPLIGPLLNPGKDLRPPTERVRARLCRDLAAFGGERYWCPRRSPLLPLLVAGGGANDAGCHFQEYTRM